MEGKRSGPISLGDSFCRADVCGWCCGLHTWAQALLGQAGHRGFEPAAAARQPAAPRSGPLPAPPPRLRDGFGLSRRVAQLLPLQAPVSAHAQKNGDSVVPGVSAPWMLRPVPRCERLASVFLLLSEPPALQGSRLCQVCGVPAAGSRAGPAEASGSCQGARALLLKPRVRAAGERGTPTNPRGRCPLQSWREDGQGSQGPPGFQHEWESVFSRGGRACPQPVAAHGGATCVSFQPDSAVVSALCDAKTRHGGG